MRSLEGGGLLQVTPYHPKLVWCRK